MHKKLFTLVLALLICNTPSLHAAQVLFTPAVIVQQEFTDNLFLDYQDEVDDTITIAGLDLTTEVLWRTAGLQLNYRPTYNAFADNDYLDYWRHSATIDAWKQFQRNTRLEFTDNFLRSNDPIDQNVPTTAEGAPPQGPVVDTDRNRRGRNKYYTNVAELRLTHQFGAENSVYGAYQHRLLRDVDTTPGMPVDDYDFTRPIFGFAYNFTRKWGVQFDVFYEDRNYVDRNDRSEFNGNVRILHNFDRALSVFYNYRHTVIEYDQDTDENYKIYEPSLGFRYNFQNDMYVEFSAAYYVQDFEISEDDQGFNINSDLYKRWNLRTGYVQISGGSGYEIDDYGTADNGLDIYATCTLDAGYNFTQRLQGTFSGSYRYDKYPNESPEVIENTTRLRIGLDWQAKQWMVVGLSYTFSDVESDTLVNEYTENRAMLSVRIAPASPYRWF